MGEPTCLVLRDGYYRVVVSVQVLGVTSAETPGYRLAERFNNLVGPDRAMTTPTFHSFIYLISPFVILWKPHPLGRFTCNAISCITSHHW